MGITHHPPDDTVLRYANGTLPEAPAIVVATHLSFCPDCRVRMHTYEMLGGSVLDEVAPSALSADALSITLAKLDARGPEPTTQDGMGLEAARLDATALDATTLDAKSESGRAAATAGRADAATGASLRKQ